MSRSCHVVRTPTPIHFRCGVKKQDPVPLSFVPYRFHRYCTVWAFRHDRHGAECNRKQSVITTKTQLFGSNRIRRTEPDSENTRLVQESPRYDHRTRRWRLTRECHVCNRFTVCRHSESLSVLLIHQPVSLYNELQIRLDRCVECEEEFGVGASRPSPPMLSATPAFPQIGVHVVLVEIQSPAQNVRRHRFLSVWVYAEDLKTSQAQTELPGIRGLPKFLRRNRMFDFKG